MLLPYGHEDLRARRWPVVTTAIIAICGVAFVASFVAEQALEPQVEQQTDVILRLYAAHPHDLHLPPRLQAALGDAPPSELESLAAVHDRSHLTPLERERAQQEIDDAGVVLDGLLARLPDARFGYLPARPRVLQLFTSMFMHADVFHILGNLWFLWLAAVSLEDRWGRPVFAGFYLVAGVVAAVAYGLTTARPDVPLIGASGAIAGVMGAFLVLFAKTRIQFVYFYYRVGRFAAPAYVMLPLWLAEQAFDAIFYADSDGIAYGAHLGGFAFGALVAVGLKFSGLDARLDRSVEGTVSIDLDPRIERAEIFQSQGRSDEARALATAVIADEDKKHRERSNDVVGALRVLYTLDKDQPSYERFVRLLAVDDLTLDEAARITAARVRERGDEAVSPLAVPLRLRLAKRLDRLGDADAAARVRPA